MKYVHVAERRDGRSQIPAPRSYAAARIALGILLCLTGQLTQANPNTKKILILFSFSNRDYASLDRLKSALQTAISLPVDFYVEYLGGRRFDEEGYEKALVGTLRHSYREQKLDLVLVQSYTGLQFTVRHHDELFPGVPVIFIDVEPDQIAGQTLPGVTGVTAFVDIPGTINLALHLQPKTNTVAVITTNSTPDKYFLARIHAELLHHQDKVREVDLVSLPTSQLMERIAQLPPQTVVLFQLAPQESVQPAIGPVDLLSWVSQRLPTYSIFPEDVLNHGGIGGVSYDWNSEIPLAADEAKRLLSGERPESIPLVHYRRPQIKVDWRALRRWRIPESALPPGSVVFYREPTLWERYWIYIVAAIVVIAIQFLLIVGLVWQRARKRKSEERFRLAAQAGKMFAYEWDAATDVIQRSPEFVQVLGFDGTAQTTGRQILDQVHAEDREKVMAALAELSLRRPNLRISFRMLRADGTTIWVERSSRAEFSKQGKLQRIVGMVADITERKHAEEQLQESEERFRLVATTAPVMIWMSGPSKGCTYFNQPWLTFTGRSIHDELGNGWAEGVHPEDSGRCLETYNQAFDRREPFEMEYRLRRHDGEYRWIFDYGVPRFNADGSFAGYIGSASDLTDQRLAREALEKVSGQLIDAQEKERRRLARELHDDICQRLAMLSLKIEKVTKDWGRGQSPAHQLEQIWQQCSDLTVDVQALSHELHPSILDNLGLVTAIRSFCREVSEHSGVVVEFDGRDVSASLPSEVSLSLFRVFQEALHNAVKYSGQKHFEVRLQEVSGDIELQVRDEGVGFDATLTQSGGGLGLVSMAERVHQVNGTFTIDSHPNAGTRIRARVPLRGETKAITTAAN